MRAQAWAIAAAQKALGDGRLPRRNGSIPMLWPATSLFVVDLKDAV
jgi:hypothetical protein